LETLELSRGCREHVPLSFGSVVKDQDYLVDNLCIDILS
jgi:hypothetical protein